MQPDQLRRRQFLTLLGGAAVCPLAARAQQPPMPVIGILSGVLIESYADRVAAIRQGLKETGFVEGQNLAIEYRSAEGFYERLPGFAADLVRRQVKVIVAIGGGNSEQAAKSATSTIPIVFASGVDALETGLVASLSRPEGNMTGASFNNTPLNPKRLELLRELVPSATKVGFFFNLNPPSTVEDIITAARAIGIEIVILSALNEREIDLAFTTMVQQRVGALLVSNDAFFTSRRAQITALAIRHALPAMYGAREFVAAGGLASYAPRLSDMYRWAGIYSGRILKGAKPGDLPVVQPTRYELVINLATAKVLGLTVPLTLQVAADEVIE